MEYGIQMFSVRDMTDKDLEGSIRAVAEMGYSNIEYAGFFGHSAKEIAAWQDKYGVKCSGTHSGWGELLPENLEKTVEFYSEIGAKNFIVPGADLSTLEKIDEFAAVMNNAKPVMEKAGIRLGYHNHSHEFVLMPWGSTIHSELEKRTETDFEIDTFWAFNAGTDPIQVLDRLKDRIHVIHLKDGFRGGRGMSLGEGEAPVREARKKAIEMGVLMVVESESLTPDGKSEVKRCIDFLRECDKND